MNKRHVLLNIIRLACAVSLLWALSAGAASASSPQATLSQLGGASYAVANYGDLVLLGMGPNLTVLSISDGQWSTVGSLHLPDIVRGLAVDGSTVYVAAGTAGLRIVSLVDPTSPVEIGSVALTGAATAVAVSAGYAYVPAGQGRLAAIDIRSPSNPGAPYYATIAGEGQNIAIAGSYAYVAAAWGALRVLSLANPAQPVQVGAYEQVYEVTDVAIVGSYAFLAAGEDGLKILSLSDPIHPALVTSEPLDQGIVRSVVVTQAQGGSPEYAYLAVQNAGLWIVSVSNPALPVASGPVATVASDGRDLALASGRLYLADGAGGAAAYDLSSPGSPAAIASYSLLGDARDTALADGLVFVAGGALGLHSLSYQEGQWNLLDTVDTPGEAVHVALAGSYAYVADRDRGLQVISISDPSDLRLVGSLQGPGLANAVAVRGGWAYVAAGEGGLWLVSLADPTTPSLQGTVPTPGEAMGLALAGDYAYVASGDSGLQVVWLSSAQRVGDGADTFGFASSVALGDGLAFVADGTAGLAVIDVRDLGDPGVIGNCTLEGRATDLLAMGSSVYLSTEVAGLQLVSVATPEDPVHVATVDIPGSANGLGPASPDGVFVAARDGGLVWVRYEQSGPSRLYLPLMSRGVRQESTTSSTLGEFGVHASYESMAGTDTVGVTLRSYGFMPVVRRTYPPLPDAPVLNPIDNASRTDSYSVSWLAANRASSYTLEEDDNPEFSSPTAAYDGAGQSTWRFSMPAGTYYYRVRGSNEWGTGRWSATQSVYVPAPWGIWEIENDTGGNISIEVFGVAYREFPTGTHDWELPVGTHRYRASARCGSLEDTVTVPRYGRESIRFYCGIVGPGQSLLR